MVDRQTQIFRFWINLHCFLETWTEPEASFRKTVSNDGCLKYVVSQFSKHIVEVQTGDTVYDEVQGVVNNTTVQARQNNEGY